MTNLQIKLVFEDWQKRDGESVYDTEKGLELSLGDFHSGTTFNATIQVDLDDSLDLIAAVNQEGYTPVFSVFSVTVPGEETVPQVESGTILHTRDGRKIGNAIVTGLEAHDELGKVAHIETDYGNTAILTMTELDKLFYTGEFQSLEEWQAEKQVDPQHRDRFRYYGTFADHIWTEE